MSDVHEHRCPQCNALMEEGYIPTGGGMHWYRRRDGSTSDFAESLPGTFSWDRRSRLPAWRCKKCHIVAFRYGHGITKHVEDQKSAEHAGDDEAEPAGEPTAS